MANPSMSSDHDVSLPEGDGRWEESSSVILLTPTRPSLQVQLLVKQVFAPFFYFQELLIFSIVSRAFCTVKILWLSVLGRNWTVRKLISKLAETRDI